MSQTTVAGPNNLTIPELPAEEAEALGSDEKERQLSNKEEQYLSRDLSEDDMARHSRRNDWGRQEAFRKVFEILAILSLITLFITMFVVGVVWLWHMIMPNSKKWLTSDQVTILQDILTGGLVASLIGPHFKRRLEKL